MKEYLRLLSYIKPYKARLFQALFCLVVAAAANLSLPWIIKDMIDKVLAARNMNMLNIICIGIVAIFTVRGVFYYGQGYLVSYIGQKVIADVRDALFQKLQRLPMAFFDKRKTGEIMSYVSNDVAALQSALVERMVEALTEASIFVGSLVMMALLDYKLSILTLITVPLVGAAMDIFGRKVRRAGALIQERLSDITALMQESIASERAVKSFVRESYEIQRFHEQNELNFRAAMKDAQLSSLLTPTVELLAALGVTVIIWFGGKEVVDGVITAGTLVAFLTYAVNLSNPVKRLSRIYAQIQKAMAGADRVFALLDMEETVNDAKGAKVLPPISGEVEFSDVTFSYGDGKNALSHVNISAKPGQMVALVGPSGAGKSTVANLLPRFYDADEGTITVDGFDVRDVTLESLRTQIGIVPQETMLFSATARENIRYGRLDATDEEVEKAAKDAGAHDFISALSSGYDTIIGERGSSLSGGQRQRIAIARAILKDPRILILDEATSALDTESEKLVQRALNRLMVGRTSFVIAHRLSTVAGADWIYVLDGGKIAEEGTHESLLAAGGLYANLCRIHKNGASRESDAAVPKTKGEA